MAKRGKFYKIQQEKDETIMFRKNMYITRAQDRGLKKVFSQYGKSESQQLREALVMYFEQLGIKL